MQETVGAQSVETKADTKTRVFISYSRKDMAFADKLEAALKARGFEVLIDRQEIYAFEDWWKRIQALIGQADTVVYVLSPDSVKSDVALKEVSYAASLNKRFAPIVCRRVDDSSVPEALRRLNFIFFDDADQFDASADKLAEALRTDIGWIRQHTEHGEAERRWSAGGRPRGLLLHSPTLEVAEYWISSKPTGAPEPTEEIRSFVAASRQVDVATRRRSRILNAALYTMLLGIILGLVGWINQVYIADQWRFVTITWPYEHANVWPYVLSRAKEQALKPKDTFRECRPERSVDYCPEMIVVPAGSFLMGSPTVEEGYVSNEGPQHEVAIAKPFAVSKYEITFDEWDTCARYGDCNTQVKDGGWGRGFNPVIYVSRDDAEQYVGWLSKITGKTYRLLTEAEYEYAARAGTQTRYPWGNDIKVNGRPMAVCNGCGTRWDNIQTAPVGWFPPNKFGLYDMVGNVWEWVEDCYHPGYEVSMHQGEIEMSAPTDGSSWNTEECYTDVLRGGSFGDSPRTVRSASRGQSKGDVRLVNVGFRVARTLDER